MFSNNQNHLFLKSSEDAEREAIDKCLNKIFFDKLKKPEKCRQMASIEKLNQFQDEKISRGFGMNGFEDRILSLSSKNLDVVINSLEKLEQELKNPHLVCEALNLKIIKKLHPLIYQNFNVHPLTLKILNLLAKSMAGSILIAENKELIKSILTIMKHKPDISDACVVIFQTLCGNPHAAQELLNSKYFVEELQHFIYSTSSEKFFSVLSHFIAVKPETFAKIEILKSLINNISKSKALKCLALILNCDDCQHHVRQMKIENLLLDALVGACDDETKTYAVMAFRNYLTYTNICTDEFPWKWLLRILIESSYTKKCEGLQESCIQTLRIMSDVLIVKDFLRKRNLRKLRGIPAMTEKAKEMKEDLLDWLMYRNYKVTNESNKYSKLFI